jgi:hypothetical protein
VAPMLAVICAQHPDGQVWLEKQIIESVRRWKAKHRALAKSGTTKSFAGGHGDALIQGEPGEVDQRPQDEDYAHN